MGYSIAETADALGVRCWNGEVAPELGAGEAANRRSGPRGRHRRAGGGVVNDERVLDYLREARARRAATRLGGLGPGGRGPGAPAARFMVCARSSRQPPRLPSRLSSAPSPFLPASQRTRGGSSFAQRRGPSRAPSPVPPSSAASFVHPPGARGRARDPVIHRARSARSPSRVGWTPVGMRQHPDYHRRQLFRGGPILLRGRVRWRRNARSGVGRTGPWRCSGAHWTGLTVGPLEVPMTSSTAGPQPALGSFPGAVCAPSPERTAVGLCSRCPE